MKIYSVTLNPAYDIHAVTEEFVPFHENLACIRSREAGGKGVNISRALKLAGVPNRAVVVLGKENAEEFRGALEAAGLDCLYFEKAGRIRENLTLHSGDGRETRISFAGFPVDKTVLREISDRITVDADTVVTFTGRVPEGIGMDAAMAFLQEWKERGVKLVLDSRSFSLEDIYELKPWLIKPNQEEISAYFGCSVGSISEAVEKAREFAAHGIENAMISLGDQGALLISGHKLFVAVPPQIRPVSTIGAGDSSIAGFITAAFVGKTAGECLRSAVAFGTAACLTEGSQPPEQEKIKTILEQIQIKVTDL